MPAPEIKTEPSISPDTVKSSDTASTVKAEMATPGASTLIEFPGARSMPQWRKQLSERVREIQERRAREASRDVEEVVPAPPTAPPAVMETSTTTPLGLVPPPPPQEMNPLVVAALRRIERARQTQPMPAMSRSRGGAAVARVAEESYREDIEQGLLDPVPQVEQAAATKPSEVAREHNLVVVPAPVKAEPEVKPEPGRVAEAAQVEETFDEFESDVSTESAQPYQYDDRAPVFARLAASAIDFLVVVFASSPFAAVIELTNGNWSDPRVAGSMGAIALVVMFLYLTSSTALAGRTWGMSLLSLRAVDADTGLQPTTRQAIVRALAYMVSLAALGIGVIYAIFDAEGRTAHDHFSGTAVIQE